MKTRDWIIISGITLGAFLLTRKAFGESFLPNPDIVDDLENANPASLPITPNADELRVMQYADIMMYEGKQQGVDPSIIAGIIRAESSGIPSTITMESAVNSYSYGLMQILIETANDMKRINPWLKYDNNPGSLLIPDINIQIGTSYLALQYKRYTKKPVLNPITDMIASYNAGTAFVDDNYTYTNSKGNPKVQAYVDRVMEYRFRFRMMFQYLYSTFDSSFPPAVWGL